MRLRGAGPGVGWQAADAVGDVPCDPSPPAGVAGDLRGGQLAGVAPAGGGVTHVFTAIGGGRDLTPASIKSAMNVSCDPQNGHISQRSPSRSMYASS